MLRIKWSLIWILFVFLIITLFAWIRYSPTLIISSNETHFNETLKKILVPRWVQSEGHLLVSQFIGEELNRLGFSVNFDRFDEPFLLTNIIGITNPKAERFLLMSCHYDSKFLESVEFFVSATDAGVSCAILLNMAKTLSTLTDIDIFNRIDVGLVLAFFDGHDSTAGINDGSHPLYGSKHLVKTDMISLKTIDLVITLNFIGAPNHIFMSKYERTFLSHELLANIEMELKESGQLQKCHQLFYKLKDHYSDIEDDHFPFLEAGVPAMHIVPHTYPDVWLKKEDNIENLHWPSVRNINAIITRFVYDYFEYYIEIENN